MRGSCPPRPVSSPAEQAGNPGEEGAEERPKADKRGLARGCRRTCYPLRRGGCWHQGRGDRSVPPSRGFSGHSPVGHHGVRGHNPRLQAAALACLPACDRSGACAQRSAFKRLSCGARQTRSTQIRIPCAQTVPLPQPWTAAAGHAGIGASLGTGDRGIPRPTVCPGRADTTTLKGVGVGVQRAGVRPPYIPSGPLGEAEVPGSRSSRSTARSMLCWRRSERCGPAGGQGALALAGPPSQEAGRGGGGPRG